MPNAWATLKNIEQLFNPWPTVPSYVTDLINWVLPHVPAYVPPANSVKLPGQYQGRGRRRRAGEAGGTAADLAALKR